MTATRRLSALKPAATPRMPPGTSSTTLPRPRSQTENRFGVSRLAGWYLAARYRPSGLNSRSHAGSPGESEGLAIIGDATDAEVAASVAARIAIQGRVGHQSDPL